MTTLRLKRGDTKPDLVVTVTDPVATFGTVDTWKVIIRRSDETFTDEAPTVDTSDAGTAVVTHEWDTLETDTIGNLDVEVEATWPDGSVQTFPNDGYRRVSITQDLG